MASEAEVMRLRAALERVLNHPLIRLTGDVEILIKSALSTHLEWDSGSVEGRSVAEAGGRLMYEVGLDKGQWYWMHNWSGLHKEEATSEDAAKIAAQNDFASRRL